MEGSLFTLRRVWLLLGLMGVWIFVLSVLLARWVPFLAAIDPLVYVVLTGALCYWFLLACRMLADRVLLIIGFTLFSLASEYLVMRVTYYPFDWFNVSLKLVAVAVASMLPVRSLRLHKAIIRR